MAKKRKTKRRKSGLGQYATCGCPTIEEAKAILAKQNRNGKTKATLAGDEVEMASNGMCMVDVKQTGLKGALKGRVTKRFLKRADCG